MVHDAHVRLLDVEKAQQWDSLAHFFADAAEAMRRILVNHARDKLRIMRGGGRRRLDLERFPIVVSVPDEDLLVLDEALIRTRSRRNLSNCVSLLACHCVRLQMSSESAAGLPIARGPMYVHGFTMNWETTLKLAVLFWIRTYPSFDDPCCPAVIDRDRCRGPWGPIWLFRDAINDCQQVFCAGGGDVAVQVAGTLSIISCQDDDGIGFETFEGLDGGKQNSLTGSPLPCLVDNWKSSNSQSVCQTAVLPGVPGKYGDAIGGQSKALFPYFDDFFALFTLPFQ